MREGNWKREKENEGHFHYIYLISLAAITTIVFGLFPSSPYSLDHLTFHSYAYLLFSCSHHLLGIFCSSHIISTNKSSHSYSTSIKLTSPAQELSNSSGNSFSFAVISSIPGKSTPPWESLMKSGRISELIKNKKYEIQWEDRHTLSSSLSSNNIGLILTDLIAYCGKLYTSDKSTGILYEISNQILIPRQILMSGDGMNSDSLQSSWTATKNGILYIGTKGLGGAGGGGGGMGEVSLNSQRKTWIVIVDPSGRVNHLDWVKEYTALSNAFPFDRNTHYLSHEAAIWSELRQIWIFFPTLIKTQRTPLKPFEKQRKVRGRSRHLSHLNLSRSMVSGPQDLSLSLLSSLRIMVCTADFKSIDVRSFDSSSLSPLSLFPDDMEKEMMSNDSQFRIQILSAKFLPDSQDNLVMSILSVSSLSSSSTSVRSFFFIFGLDGSVPQSLIEISSENDPVKQQNMTFVGIEFL